MYDCMFMHTVGHWVNSQLLLHVDTKILLRIQGFVQCICILRSMNSYLLHVWQSRVEIEHYSVAYFERITQFKAL